MQNDQKRCMLILKKLSMFNIALLIHFESTWQTTLFKSDKPLVTSTRMVFPTYTSMFRSIALNTSFTILIKVFISYIKYILCIFNSKSILKKEKRKVCMFSNWKRLLAFSVRPTSISLTFKLDNKKQLKMFIYVFVILFFKPKKVMTISKWKKYLWYIFRWNLNTHLDRNIVFCVVFLYNFLHCLSHCIACC